MDGVGCGTTTETIFMMTHAPWYKMADEIIIISVTDDKLTLVFYSCIYPISVRLLPSNVLLTVRFS